jgi:ADP-heptose:LPS heptosyltransferase
LATIPANELALEVLDACLRDGTWPARSLEDLIERALDEDNPFAAAAANRALFSIVIERLGDLFEPALCDVYARLFSHIISRALPEYSSRELLTRYHRIRQPRRFQGGDIHRVFVLSRVTLGADAAVTSVALAMAKARFPGAEVCLVGPEKNAELFAADPAVKPLPVTYGRSSLLRERLLAAAELKVTVDETGTVVIDPDSRLTQLGLIPVCDDSRYFFFESRAYGGTTDSSLSELASDWLAAAFDTDHFHAYVAPHLLPPVAQVTVSLGVGENADKRLSDDFETAAVRTLVASGCSVLIDRGAGGEEADRVTAIAKELGSPANLHLHDGSYANFASHIVQSSLHVGYDSAGQHVAAAARVPLVSIFAGYASERMFQRWRPTTANARVLPVAFDQRSAAEPVALQIIAEAVAAEVQASPTGRPPS